ncbi:MAG TPA: cyclic nucleotide-binding domain-containing protein [Actinomycetota bacterium]
MDVERVKSIPLFADLSQSERELVARHADEVEVEAGRHLIEEGEIGWEFFVIESGAVEVKVGDDPVATLGPGDFFGEVALKDESHRRTATVVATEPSTLIVMTGQAFRTFEGDMPALAERIREAAERYGR